MPIINNKSVFYIIAHPDDWQLFFGHQACHDLLSPSTHVVFIYITAGDAGRLDGWWRAREQGTQASIRCLFPSDSSISQQVIVNGHSIKKNTGCHSVSYYLRLPDGLPDGVGSAIWNQQSITKLRDHGTPIQSIDGATTYASWQDLCSTINQILTIENKYIEHDSSWINAADYSRKINPDDHADHTATADAVRAIANGRYHCAWWLTYYTYYCPSNIFGDDLSLKKLVFDSYCTEIELLMGVNDSLRALYDLEWRCWGSKAYRRVVLKHEASMDRPNFHLGCPRPDQLNAEQLLNKTLKYKQCGSMHQEWVKDELRITNLLTQKKVLLNSVAAVLWTVLTQAHSFHDLSSILHEVNAEKKEHSHEQAIECLLTTLLNAKLIVSFR